MTESEQKLIRDAIELGAKEFSGGVRTFVDANGDMASSWVEWKRYTGPWTDEHRAYAIQVYREIYAAAHAAI